MAFYLLLFAFAAEYQFCFLKDGPNSGKIEAKRAEQLQTEHRQHILAMWKSGELESAGPISGLPEARGIFLFHSSTEAAAKLAAADPKAIAGELRIDCQSWIAPAGIGRVYREAAAKAGFAEKYVRRVGVLMKIATPLTGLGGVKVAGVMQGGDYRYFALLDHDRLEAVKDKLPDSLVFLWFHDERVWDGIEP